MTVFSAKMIEQTVSKTAQEIYQFFDLDKKTVEISTPYLDNDFDHISLFVTLLKEDQFEISDFGVTLFNLPFQIPSIIKEDEREAFVAQFISELNVDEKNGVLSVKAGTADFFRKQVELLQAIVQLNHVPALVKSFENHDTAHLTDFLPQNR